MRVSKKTIVACCVTFALAVALTLGCMTIFNVGIGDKVFVSMEDYDEIKAVADKYSELEQLHDFLEENYYTEIEESDLMTGIYKGLFSGTGDPYTTFLTADEYQSMLDSYSGEFEGIGVMMSVSASNNIEIISVVEDTPAQKAGIKDGDLIIAVDGVRYTGSQLQEATNAMRGEKGTEVTLTISRNGVMSEYTIVRAPISEVSVTHKMLDNNIGYIRVNSFRENTADQFSDALSEIEKAGAAGLVVDIRSNGGGLVEEAVEIADMLMDAETIVYLENGKGEKTYYKSEAGRTALNYVVLVNGGSASSSEILVAGIQGNKEGTIVGTQTYGKGITQNTWKLRSGCGVKITTAQYFGPNGEVIHKQGITPDVVVELQESDVQDGVLVNDRQLQEAVKLLLK